MKSTVLGLRARLLDMHRDDPAFQAYLAKRSELEPHAGKWVLMIRGKVIDVFETGEAAREFGFGVLEASLGLPGGARTMFVWQIKASDFDPAAASRPSVN